MTTTTPAAAIQRLHEIFDRTLVKRGPDIGKRSSLDVSSVLEVMPLLDALSTPPADDVRELVDHLNGLMDSLDESVTHDQIYEQLQVAWNMARALRPRGTVAEDAREAEMRELHHFEVEQQLAETIAVVKRAQAAVLRHEHTPASLHMDAILDEVNTEIPSGAEVRPRGTVPDAETHWEFGVSSKWGTVPRHSQADAEVYASDLRKSIAAGHESGNTAHHGVVMRRRASVAPGPWEVVASDGEARS